MKAFVRASAFALVAQFVSFASGIIIVRSLAPSEYAAYAASAAIVSAIAIVADSGVGSILVRSAASAQGDRLRYASVYSSALRIRRLLFIVTVVPAVLLLVYILGGTGQSTLAIVTLILLSSCLAYSSLTRSVRAVDLQLSGRIGELQATDGLNAMVRLVLVCLAAISGYVSAVIVAAISLLGSVSQSFALRASFRKRNMNARPDTTILREMRSAIRATAPSSVLLIVGEQLVNVLCVWSNNAVAIGQISALTRYSLGLIIVNSVIGNYAARWIARAPMSRPRLQSMTTRVASAALAICAGYVLAMWLLSPALLEILGPAYTHLKPEFLIVAAGSALQYFGAYGLGILTHNRGWIARSWTYAPALAVWLVGGLTVVRPTDSQTAALLWATLPLVTIFTQLMRVCSGLRRTDGGKGATA